MLGLSGKSFIDAPSSIDILYSVVPLGLRKHDTIPLHADMDRGILWQGSFEDMSSQFSKTDVCPFSNLMVPSNGPKLFCSNEREVATAMVLKVAVMVQPCKICTPYLVINEE